MINMSIKKVSRWILGEVGFAALIILPSAFAIGSFYVTSWNWPTYWISVQVSSAFYIVMRFTMQHIAKKVVEQIIPRSLEKSKKYYFIDIAVRGILGIGGTFVALALAQIVTGINFLGSIRTIYIQLFVGLTLSLLVTTSIYAVVFYKGMIGKAKDAQEARELAVKAELKALRAQVNPHFLFNTLNSISALIAIDPKRADLMVQRLSEVFRYVLTASEKEWTTLEEEWQFLDNYLEIERIRFDEKLRVEKFAEPGVLRAKIPGLLLQPIVENAIKHGLSNKVGSGLLIMRAIQKNGDIEIEITDDGEIGFSTDSQNGMGLKNVRDRIQKSFGEKYGLTIESAVPGTRVRITLPNKA